MAMASSLDVIGPLTNSVADARAVFNAIRGADPKDATSHNIKGTKKLFADGSLKGVKVGVPREYFLPGLDAEVEGCVQSGIAKLKGLGAEIVDISLPNAEHGLAAYYVIMPAEASTNLSRFDGVRYPASQMAKASSLIDGYIRSRAAFGAEVQRRILVGTYVLSAGYYDAYYRQAQKVRGLIVKDFNEAWRKVDIIVSPTSPTIAWPIGEKVNDPLAMYLSDIFTINANLVGIPSISLPCGESDGLPVGLQLAAPRDEDLFLLDVAEAFEQSNNP
jgi:aspartyl-tRNA(Asn)/glutamyl-tRNA(Gln) amidotransferase subunit A